MKKILLSIFVLVLFIGCNDHTENKQTIPEKIIPPKDNGIVLTDTVGNQIKVTKSEDKLIFQGYENKVVLLNFFATWCSPCLAAIPSLNNLQNKYKDDIKILSILLEENKSNHDVMRFINNNNIQFTITNSPDNNKLKDEVGKVDQIPHMVIYDKNGKYFKNYNGAILEEMIDIDIQQVIK